MLRRINARGPKGRKIVAVSVANCDLTPPRQLLCVHNARGRCTCIISLRNWPRTAIWMSDFSLQVRLRRQTLTHMLNGVSLGCARDTSPRPLLLLRGDGINEEICAFWVWWLWNCVVLTETESDFGLCSFCRQPQLRCGKQEKLHQHNEGWKSGRRQIIHWQ